jgi:hypothetical protein
LQSLGIVIVSANDVEENEILAHSLATFCKAIEQRDGPSNEAVTLSMSIHD